MILAADDPRSWTAQHFATVFPDHLPSASGRPHVRRSTAELVDGGLEELVEQLISRGTPRPAAGMHLSGWYGGVVSWYLGFALLTADAAFGLQPGAVDYWCHPEGWADALGVSDPVTAAVLPGHPWAGRDEVVVVAGRRQQAERVLGSLLGVLGPVVDTLQRLTGAGRVGLWHEVSDGLASAAVYQDVAPVSQGQIDMLGGILDLPGAPWRRRPRLELRSGPSGEHCLMHKGGCCLAYTVPASDAHQPDPDHDAFEAAFPGEADRPDYCITCKFRTFEESATMQLWWRAREAGAGPG